MRRVITLDRLRVVRVPGDPTFWLLALLFAGLSVQSARLVWAIVTPVTPIGDWRPASAAIMGTDAQAAIFAAVNPFGGATPGTAAAFPSDLKLFGVRAAAGGLRGGAIIQLPDGSQISVSEGDSVMPGVTLAAVGFDFADVVRDGGRQRLFLDPDKAPETVGAAAATAAVPTTGALASGGLSASQLRAAVSLSPRTGGTGINGILVASGSNAADFARSGLRAGDVVVSVNGATISAAQDLAQLQQSLVPGASLSLVVERGGQRVPITINLTSNP